MYLINIQLSEFIYLLKRVSVMNEIGEQKIFKAIVNCLRIRGRSTRDNSRMLDPGCTTIAMLISLCRPQLKSSQARDPINLLVTVSFYQRRNVAPLN